MFLRPMVYKDQEKFLAKIDAAHKYYKLRKSWAANATRDPLWKLSHVSRKFYVYFLQFLHGCPVTQCTFVCMEYACASTFSLNTHINFSKSSQKKNWGHVFKCDTPSIAREDVPRGVTQGSASNLKLNVPLQATFRDSFSGSYGMYEIY